ncbi:unnamed protein product [Protopolystoma xenopodis]|uniref:Uncharacterized protein n=1 Tax=Protopolystoma xenopodis TaxID=117903 RepID=A0A448WK70_9PLAT|nr:unnamed protein product [Protopolystoma xenopodis]
MGPPEIVNTALLKLDCSGGADETSFVEFGTTDQSSRENNTFWEARPRELQLKREACSYRYGNYSAINS